MVSRTPYFGRFAGAKRMRSRSKATRHTRARTWIPRAIGNGAPAGQLVKMKYSQQVSMSDAITGQAEQVFRAFSIYDPDLTGVGEQPLSHDQWATLYKRYRVKNSKIRVVMKNTYGDVDYPQAVTAAICLTDTSTAIGDAATVCEMPISAWTMLGNSDGGGAVRELNLKAIPQHVVKGDNGVKYDNDYTASFGGSPTLDSYYHIYLKAEGGTNLSVRIRVLIEYDVWCYDPVQLAES